MSSSDEDEKKKASINEMFGDDDSDDDLDTGMRATSSSATTADASGLFGSDSESEEERKPKKKAVPPPKKLKASASKKRRSGGDRGAPPKASRASQDDRPTRGEGSGDEYDSGDDVVRTKEDDDFIDGDDDLEDVLGEYDEDNQKFDDERPLPEDEGKRKEEDFFDSTLRSLKTGRGRRKMNLSVQEQEQIVQEVLYRMDKAHADDLASIAERKPALERIKYVDEAIRALRKHQLQPTFLDFDLLSFIKKWIQPLEDGSLPNLGVRTKMLQMVANLPVMKEHLKRSGFGKVVMLLWKHPSETRENKDLCRDLIERWSRAVFDKTLDYSKLAELEAEKAENMGYRRPDQRPAQKKSYMNRGGDSANPFSGRSSEPRDGVVTERAIMPKALRVDFLHRPQPKVELQQQAQQKVENAETRKSRLAKRMQEIARPGRKGKRAVSVSIEGR